MNCKERLQGRADIAEIEMLMIPVLTAVCSAGVVFYLRFLVALCRECKPRLTGYWVRLRLHSDEEGVIAMKPIEKPVTRAA